jgi:hypothetical protein
MRSSSGTVYPGLCRHSAGLTICLIHLLRSMHVSLVQTTIGILAAQCINYGELALRTSQYQISSRANLGGNQVKRMLRCMSVSDLLLSRADKSISALVRHDSSCIPYHSWNRSSARPWKDISIIVSSALLCCRHLLHRALGLAHIPGPGGRASIHFVPGQPLPA